MPEKDNTNLYTGRADAYTKYRSSYPPSVVTHVADHYSLPPSATIADMGSGTGIVSKLILNTLSDVKVVGVEPNADMRKAQEESLRAEIEMGSFHSQVGSAEASGLDDQSVDLAIAGAAFHWFDTAGTRRECLRVIKPSSSGNGRPFAIISRHRRPEDDYTGGEPKNIISAMQKLYQDHGLGHVLDQAWGKLTDENMQSFYGNDAYQTTALLGTEKRTVEQIVGRMQSQSHVPSMGTKEGDSFYADLKAGLEKFQNDGVVEHPANLEVICGYLT